MPMRSRLRIWFGHLATRRSERIFAKAAKDLAEFQALKYETLSEQQEREFAELRDRLDEVEEYLTAQLARPAYRVKFNTTPRST